MRRIIFTLGAGLFVLSIGTALPSHADDAEPAARPSRKIFNRASGAIVVPATAKSDAEADVDAADQILMNLLIVELRGNVQRALKEADFHEAPGGHRYTSATGRSSGAGSDWQSMQLNSMKAYAEVDVLSRPQVRSLLGQSAEIQVSGGVPEIAYLVRTGKKTFELKEAVAQPKLGIAIHLTAQAVAEDSDQIEISPLTIATTTFDGREPIPGFDLDVGKPIISTRKLETSITLTDGGETSGIMLPGPTGRQPILFISVRRVSKDGRDILPNPVTDVAPSPVPSATSKPK
ncbi:MAG TPA: hypothetical protein VGM05_34695 [Planctomycetaceae bacterium]|jgi:hypothetical protein